MGSFILSLPKDPIYSAKDLVFTTYSDNFNNMFYRTVHLKYGIISFCDNKECALNQIIKFHDELKISKLGK